MPVTNTKAQALEVALDIGCEPSVAQTAIENIFSGTGRTFCVSGKMASGKDVVARRILWDRGLAVDNALKFQASFADPLKTEVGEFYNKLGAQASSTSFVPQDNYAALAQQMGLSQDEIFLVLNGITDNLAAYTADQLPASGYERSPENRMVLQLYGTDVRRKNDENYWSRLWQKAAIERLGTPGSILFASDVRFPNEVVAAQQIGIPVIRLDVSDTERHARIFARDSIVIDPTAPEHSSETALNDYVGFDLVVDNNGALETTISKIIAQL